MRTSLQIHKAPRNRFDEVFDSWKKRHTWEEQIKQIPEIRIDYVEDDKLAKWTNLVAMFDHATVFELGQLYYPASIVLLNIEYLFEIQYFGEPQVLTKYSNELYEEVILTSNNEECILPITNNKYLTMSKTFFFKSYDEMEEFISFALLMMPSDDLDISVCKLPLIQHE